MASHVADHIPVICPSGLHSQHKFIPDEFVFACPKKSTKRKGTPTSLPCGFPHHSTLPAGRPDSPFGLDRTKFDVHVGHLFYFFGPTKAECLGKLHGENVPPVKLAEACPEPAEADSFTDRGD